MSRRRFLLVALVLLAGGLAGYLVASGRALAQDDEDGALTSGRSPVAPEIAVGTAFTYQGSLDQSGSPYDGLCDFDFYLFDAAAAGNQVGANVLLPNVAVSGGIFTVQLDFGAGAFRGDARWLEVRVRCPAGGAGWSILEPRQPLTAAPYAHSLRPGAVISGSLASAMLTIHNGAGDGVYVYDVGGASNHLPGAGGVAGFEVAGSAGSGLYVGRTDQDGIHIRETGLEGVDVENSARDGFEVDNAAQDGLHVGTAGSDGVQVALALDDGFDVVTANNDGLLVGDAGDEGVQINSAGAHGVEVGTTGNNGVRIVNAGTNGVRVESATSDGFEVNNAGEDGVHVGTTGVHGVQVVNAGENGVHIDHADENGVYICSTGSNSNCSPNPFGMKNGLEIRNADDNGVYVASAGVAGVWARGNDDGGIFFGDDDSNGSGDGLYAAKVGAVFGEWGINTPDKLLAEGGVFSTALTIVALVAEGQELEAGDLAAASGLAAITKDEKGSVPVPLVTLAGNGSNLVGVVQGRMAMVTDPLPEGIEAEELRPKTSLRSQPGPAQPGDYVAITVLGVAQVKVDPGMSIQPGQRLTVAADGAARPLQQFEVALAGGGAATMTEQAPTVGVALGAPDDQGMVWVLVNPQ